MDDIILTLEDIDNINLTIDDIIETSTISDHSQLTNLDYTNSGHIGFASSIQLTNEQNARIAADADLSDSISELSDDLEDEVEARTSADTTLSNTITSEISRATLAEETLQDNIDDEETARQSADTVLTNAVNSRSLITETGNKIDLEINTTDYKLVAKLYDKNNSLISTSSVIDLPLESVVVSASYDSINKKIILTLKNGSTIEVPIGDLITGLATESYVNNKVSQEATARENADNLKVDKVTGKGLSSNDYTDAEKNKLADIQTGAEVNVQSDWNQTNVNADDYIKNKPTIPVIPEVPTKTSNLTNDGDGTSPFATQNYVALNGGKIDKIQKNGQELTIVNKTVNIPVPTNNNELTNGAGYITSAALSPYATTQDVQQGLATRQVLLSNDQLAAANSGITSSKISDYDEALNDIDSIQEKIPNAASSSNQLADKDFVNSTVATQTANFLGTLDVVDDLGLQYGATTSAIVIVLNSYAFASKTNNDYCFVINKDINNNTIYERFKWNAVNLTFAYEYTLNNSSFTASQWNAISSGITSGKVTNYDNHITNTNNPHNVTKTQVGLGNVDNTSDANKPISTATQNAITAEQTARQNADTTLNNKIDKRLQVVDGYVSDANTFTTNGVQKTSIDTLNLPLNDYNQDRWGILEYISENDTDVTGVQIWKCIAYAGSTHRGEIYTRCIINGTATTWKKITFDSELSTVAKSGSYNDLIDKPTSQTVNDATITIKKNNTTVDSFTVNQANNKDINITVPTFTLVGTTLTITDNN